MRGVRLPRRHEARVGLAENGTAIRLSCPVPDQGKVADAAIAVALHAVLVEDGGNVVGPMDRLCKGSNGKEVEKQEKCVFCHVGK